MDEVCGTGGLDRLKRYEGCCLEGSCYEVVFMYNELNENTGSCCLVCTKPSEVNRKSGGVLREKEGG